MYKWNRPTIRNSVFYSLVLLFVLFGCCRNYDVLNHEIDNTNRIIILRDTSDLVQRVYKIEEELIRLGKYQSRTDSFVDKSFASVNNSLDTMTIVIAIATIFLSWYITHADRKIRSIGKTMSDKEKRIKELVEKTEKLEDSTKEFVNEMNKNITSFYDKLKRADTESLLNRLKVVPQDIVNIEPLLLSRELVPEDFDTLKIVYTKLCEEKKVDCNCGLGDATFGHLYMMVFFQQFFGKSIQDESIRVPILEILVRLFDGAFKNDIEKAAKELAAVLSNKKSNLDRKEILYYFRKSLELSNFEPDYHILFLLKEGLADDELWELVEAQLKNEHEDQ